MLSALSCAVRQLVGLPGRWLRDVLVASDPDRPLYTLKTKSPPTASMSAELLGRLDVARRGPRVDVAPEASTGTPDLYSALERRGVITCNQFGNLGASMLGPGEQRTLTSVDVAGPVWVTGIVLDSDLPRDLTVVRIGVGAMPLNIGSNGAPLSCFVNDSTRSGIQFSRRPLLVGQSVQVTVRNDGEERRMVSGVYRHDAADPGAVGRLLDHVMAKALCDLSAPG